uniref:H15 domain-containing protein n=2 Tax=Ciona intestinalis TaxID=7719 RepID=F6SSF8_CIOIN
MAKQVGKTTKKRNASKVKKNKKRRVISKKINTRVKKTTKKRTKTTGGNSKKSQKQKSQSKKKKQLQIAPMPRAEHRGKTKTSKQIKKSESGSDAAFEAWKKHPNAPVPSARVPTYIAMVKTAIRDLTPFDITGRDAISRYIQIRYRIKNDDLLRYVLKWLVDMGVLNMKDRNYYFVGKSLVRKKTVAHVRKSGKATLKQLMK